MPEWDRAVLRAASVSTSRTAFGRSRYEAGHRLMYLNLLLELRMRLQEGCATDSGLQFGAPELQLS